MKIQVKGFSKIIEGNSFLNLSMYSKINEMLEIEISLYYKIRVYRVT